MKTDHLRVKKVLTDALLVLCKSGLNFRTEFCIEGLLGITLDNDEIFLINIKETIKNERQWDSDVIEDFALDTIEDLSIKEKKTMDLLPVETSKFYNKSPSIHQRLTTMSGSDNIELQFVVGDTSNSYMKYTELDNILGPVQQTKTNIVTDLSNAVCGGALDNVVGLDLSHCSDDDEEARSRELLSKEESLRTLETPSKTAPFCTDAISMDALTTGVTEVGLQTAHGDDPISAYSTWDTSGTALDMSLNLSEPKDLSVRRTKKKREKKVSCDQCGRMFRSENNLKKHKCKPSSDSDDLLLPELSQPLDLTIGRPDVDAETDQDVDLSLNNQDLCDADNFTCICSKTFSDYECYIDHVAICNKSKLTPYKACEICGKYFFSNSGYIKHKRLHVGAYKFRCNICHKGFFDRTHMRAHVDSSHSKVRRYECTFCGKSFFWKHHLKRHLGTCDKAKSPKELSSFNDDLDTSGE